MPGNTFGQMFKVTSFGESHGKCLGCVVDGCPPNLKLSAEDILPDLARRRPGQHRYCSQRQEQDQVEIVSGVFEGHTTGTPITLLFHNQDAKSKDYDKLKSVFRPGHADYAYFQKYGFRDYRGGGRASARETIARVGAAAIARKYLTAHHNTEVRAGISQVGTLNIQHQLTSQHFLQAQENPYAWLDVNTIPQLEAYIDAIRKKQDSVGAKIECEAINVLPGLGEPVFNKLDADLASALMGIPAVKAVEVGEGVRAVEMLGSTFRDAITPSGFQSNFAGGILGGISTGQSIRLAVSFKPTSSIPQSIQTITEAGEATTCQVTGRHDPCVGIRAAVIVEAMVLLVLMDHYLRYRAQVGTFDKPLQQFSYEEQY